MAAPPVLRLRAKTFTRFMHAQGLHSQTAIADELGLHRATVSRVLRGKAEPGHKFVASFRKKFPRESLDRYFTAA